MVDLLESKKVKLLYIFGTVEFIFFPEVSRCS